MRAESTISKFDIPSTSEPGLLCDQAVLSLRRPDWARNEALGGSFYTKNDTDVSVYA